MLPVENSAVLVFPDFVVAPTGAGAGAAGDKCNGAPAGVVVRRPCRRRCA